MSNPVEPWLRVHEVFHPFDSADTSEAAFVHALRLACHAGARLSLLCLRPEEDRAERDPFPDVRATLARWNSHRPSSGPGSQGPLDVSVRRLSAAIADPVKACVRFLENSPADLIVLTAQEQQGKMTWLRRPPVEPLATALGEMTLFVPRGVEGFVSREDGSARLKSILVPVASQPRPEPAVEAARRMMLSMPHVGGTATLLHVGEPSGLPALKLPELPGWSWNKEVRQGDVVDAILKTASEVGADLIAMATAGRHGFLDALRGTITEHVLRGARCPVLAMPVGSFLG